MGKNICDERISGDSVKQMLTKHLIFKYKKLEHTEIAWSI